MKQDYGFWGGDKNNIRTFEIGLNVAYEIFLDIDFLSRFLVRKDELLPISPRETILGDLQLDCWKCARDQSFQLHIIHSILINS